MEQKGEVQQPHGNGIHKQRLGLPYSPYLPPPRFSSTPMSQELETSLERQDSLLGRQQPPTYRNTINMDEKNQYLAFESADTFNDVELSLLKKLRRMRAMELLGEDVESGRVSSATPPLGISLGDGGAFALVAIALGNLLMGLFTLNVEGIQVQDMLGPVGWFILGLGYFTACIFEVLAGRTFTYALYGALAGNSFINAAFVLPFFNIPTAYGDTPLQLQNAQGLVNSAYAMIWFIFFIVALRVNWMVSINLASISMAAFLNALDNFMTGDGKTMLGMGLDNAAGVFLIISSVPAWYLLFLTLVKASGDKWADVLPRLPTGDVAPRKLL